MAIVSRLELNHPALGTTGGAGLHASIEALYTKIGDNMNSRWFSIADFDQTETVDLQHNFEMDINLLRYDLWNYTGGEWVKVTASSSPALSAFSIIEKVGSEDTILQITNNTGGNNLTFAVSIVNDPIYLSEGDVEDVDISTTPPANGEALVWNGTKFVPGASGDASFKMQSLAANVASIKAGSIFLDDGKELYLGSDIASLNLKTDVNSTGVTSPASSTAYYVYLDLNYLPSQTSVGTSDRKVYAVASGASGMFTVSATAPESIDKSRYVPLYSVKTDGSSNYASAFQNLAFRRHERNDFASQKVKTPVTQAAHGFTSSDFGAPLYLNGSTYTKAKADAANTAEVVGVIGTIIDANTFNLIEAGQVTVDTSVSGGALTAGTVYFLSPTTAGQITATEPTTVGHVSKPIGVANSTSTLILTQSRGVVVGGTNARTTISLANNATTTVQNVSAYEAGELAGWISIAASTPLKFYVQAQFAKNGAASDYNLAYQITGDAPPVGFSLAVTSGGLIQAVLPSISGFTSASINYALNAPAVGTAFPLSVQASSVVGAVNGAAVAAGYIGQVLSQTRLFASRASVSNGNAANVTSSPLPLTPGVWKMWGNAGIHGASGTVSPSLFYAGISLTSAQTPQSNLYGTQNSSGEIQAIDQTTGRSLAAGSDLVLSIPPSIVSVSANTDYYLSYRLDFGGGGTAEVWGSIYAVRIA